MEVLPGLPDGSFYDAVDISPSGKYVVGRYTNSVASGALSYIWSPADGMTSIGPLPGQGTPTRINAVSDAGVAVGASSIGRTGTGVSLNRAVRWSDAGGLEMLPMPSPADESQQSNAFDVLADGRIFGESASGRWLYSEATGFEMFSPEASLERINSDGTFLAGNDRDGEIYDIRAAYWTEDSGRKFLDPFIDNGERYGINGMSDDGSVIIGEQNTVGFLIWIDLGPPVRFEDYLESLNIDLEGRSILRLTGVSADGSTIIGVAGEPGVGSIAFAVVIPAPGTLPVALVGVLALRRRRPA
ncbi:MAG: hypothetical protein AAFN41_03960 [Planctomycetota bacterium]